MHEANALRYRCIMIDIYLSHTSFINQFLTESEGRALEVSFQLAICKQFTSMSNPNLQQSCISPKLPKGIKFKPRARNLSFITDSQRIIKSNCNIIPKVGKPFWIQKNPQTNRIATEPSELTSRLNEISTNLQASSIDRISIKQNRIVSNQPHDQFKLDESEQYLQSLASTLRDSIVKQNETKSFSKIKMQQMQETKKFKVKNPIKLNIYRRHQSVVRNNNKQSFKQVNKVLVCSKTKNHGRQSYDQESTSPFKLNNQKIIDKIQFMRKNLPILQQNQLFIKKQQANINQLKHLRSIWLDVDRQVELDKQIETTNKLCSQLINSIKLLKLKFNKRSFAYHDTNATSMRYLQMYKQVRQNLFRQKKQAEANQNHLVQLNQKIDKYQILSKKCDERIRNLSIYSMERRIIFLKWDIDRLKSEIAASETFQQMQICVLNNQLSETEIEIIKLSRMVPKIIIEQRVGQVQQEQQLELYQCLSLS